MQKQHFESLFLQIKAGPALGDVWKSIPAIYSKSESKTREGLDGQEWQVGWAEEDSVQDSNPETPL